MIPAGSPTPSPIPPIVLLVEDEVDTLERYSRGLETAGFWVAGSRLIGEAFAAAEELNPDVIIADIAEPAGVEALSLVDSLKRHPTLTHVPLLLLVPPQPAGPAQTAADLTLTLTKPVTSRELLDRTRELLQKSREIRQRSDRLQARGNALREKSSRLIVRAGQQTPAETDAGDVSQRPCPDCGKALDWIERGAISGVTYDYYRWCAQGCGLYCYDRDHRQWVKLA